MKTHSAPSPTKPDNGSDTTKVIDELITFESIARKVKTFEWQNPNVTIKLTARAREDVVSPTPPNQGNTVTLTLPVAILSDTEFVSAVQRHTGQ
jgi:hypothetical protein